MHLDGNNYNERILENLTIPGERMLGREAGGKIINTLYIKTVYGSKSRVFFLCHFWVSAYLLCFNMDVR